MEAIGSTHPLRRLFTGLVEHAFCTEVGMCNPRLTEYVADLLVSFVHMDRLSAIRDLARKRLDPVAAAISLTPEDRSLTQVERDRLIHRNIGDFALFWAGVYPEQLKLASRDPADVLLDYVSHGKRSYAIVSQLADENDAPPASLFRDLSTDFEYCLHGLGLVRKGWEQVKPVGHDGGEIVH